MRHFALSDDFIKWLASAGVITDLADRVVIDAKVGDIVRIYVEQYGSRDMLSVDPPPDLFGAHVTVLPKEEGSE